MSKEEFVKIQTCVLKVNIHCEGCKQKVKKILHKIEGVYTTSIDSELGKVTVSGNVDPATLIKKLNKSGKFAELWGAPKASNNSNNQNQVNNQLKNLQIGNGKGGNNNSKGQPLPQKGGAGAGQPAKSNHPPKVVLPQTQNPQRLQQLQQMKGFQDLRIPPQFMKEMKMVPPNSKDQNQKSVKFSLPEEDGLTDDEFDESDEEDDYDYDDEDELEDGICDAPPADRMKAVAGNGGQMPNMMMKNANVPNGQHQQQIKGGNNAGNKGGGGGGNGNRPVPVNIAGGGDNGKGGKKGGGNVNQNQFGGKGSKNGGCPPQDGKNGGNHGGGGAPNPANLGPEAKKGGGGINDGPHGMPNMLSLNASGNMAMAHMAHNHNNPHHFPMGPSPAAPAGYYHDNPAGAEQMAAAVQQQQQQQYAAMMMNLQRANGNERFQPMVYARPPPAVSYMPPAYQPYPYYPPPPTGGADEYAMFSDENTQSCSIM